MNTKNCIIVEAELIQRLLNNKIEVKCDELIDVFVAMNLLLNKNEINLEFMECNCDLN